MSETDDQQDQEPPQIKPDEGPIRRRHSAHLHRKADAEQEAEQQIELGDGEKRDGDINQLVDFAAASADRIRTQAELLKSSMLTSSTPNRAKPRKTSSAVMRC